ncbi:hypothetical protein KM043_013864 [Ampulex compressa]|nr:hypothetical protein KM043_013864 [Ampulex compressa]
MILVKGLEATATHLWAATGSGARPPALDHLGEALVGSHVQAGGFIHVFRQGKRGAHNKHVLAAIESPHECVPRAPLRPSQQPGANVSRPIITASELDPCHRQLPASTSRKIKYPSRSKVQLEGRRKMVPTMPPDSHKISLKIIEAIKQHPILYSTEVKGSSIKLQEFRQKVWKRISDELGLDPTWVRLRWKNLRDTYCRILKYKNKTEKGVRRKKWIFEDHLSFLKFPYESNYQPQCVELTEEYIQDINTGGISSEGLLEQLEDRNDEDYSEYLEVLEETTADPIILPESENLEVLEDHHSTKNHEVNTYAQQIQSKFRKIHPKRTKLEQESLPGAYSVLKSPFKGNGVNTSTPIFVTAPTTLESPDKDTKETEGSFEQQVYLAPEGKSGIELFFDSMAQTVKRLPPKAQADIKMDICRIVTEAEVRYFGRSTPQSTQQFIAPPGMIPKLVLIPCNMIDNQNKNRAIHTDIKTLLWGTNVKEEIFARWAQGFYFSVEEPTALVQTEGGPCAVIAPIQAFILKQLLSEGDSSTWRSVKPEKCNRLLIRAMCEITAQSTDGQSPRYFIIYLNDLNADKETRSMDESVESVIREDRDAVGTQSDYESFHSQLRIFSTNNLDDVEDFFLDRIDLLKKRYGILMFLYTVICTRGVSVIRSEISDPSEPMIDSTYGYGSQSLINLMLTGRAVSHVWDHDQDIGGLKLRGIDKQNRVGFLALLEHLRYCEVGTFLKSPSNPVWVIGSETHLSVLFSTEQSLVSLETPAEQAKRVFKRFDPEGNNFIPVNLLQNVLAELGLVADMEYVEIMTKKLDSENLGIILLASFMDEFFPEEPCSCPDTFTLYHYNGLARSNPEDRTKWPRIEIEWDAGRSPSLN